MPGPVALSRRVDFFEHLTAEARAEFNAAAVFRTVLAGQRIYGQDGHHQVMFRVVSGRVWLSYSRVDGRELLYLLLGPGECLGITTLIDGEGLPQSATARTDVTLQALDQNALAQLRRRHPCVNDALMRVMARDLRILVSYLAEAALDDLPTRLARRLLALAVPGRGGYPVVDLPQAELAAVFGVSRQTLNKLLKQLEGDGLVRVTYGEVQLLDIARLRDLCAPG